MKCNLRTREEVVQRLKNGESLAIFPAGGIATSPRIGAEAEELEAFEHLETRQAILDRLLKITCGIRYKKNAVPAQNTASKTIVV